MTRPERARGSRSHGSLDLGAHLAQRKLSYEGVGSGAGTLQEFKADGIVSPWARLEIYPLATTTEGALAGLAVFGSYARSVGLETEQASAPGVRHGTTLTHIEGGIGWRLPIARATVEPRVAYRMLTVEVKPSGAIAGLPDAKLAGPSAGLDVEIPFRSRFGLVLGAGYTLWTTAKDLIDGSPAFFSDGSAYALDAAGGLWIDIAGPISFRVVAEYTRTSYTLKGSGTYVATGATDRYLGLRSSLRLRF